MTVFKRESGKFQVKFRKKGYKPYSATFQTESEAKAKDAQLEAAWKHGIPMPGLEKLADTPAAPPVVEAQTDVAAPVQAADVAAPVPVPTQTADVTSLVLNEHAQPPMFNHTNGSGAYVAPVSSVARVSNRSTVSTARAVPMAKVTNQPIVPKEMTFADALMTYLNNVVVKKHKNPTVARLRINIWVNENRNLPFSVHTPVSQLTSAMFFQYKENRLNQEGFKGKKVSPGTVIREMSIMNAAITYVRKLGANVPHNLELEKPENPPPRNRVLTESEEVLLLSSAERSRHKQVPYIIRFLLATACRSGETLLAKWRDVNWENKTLHLPKEITKTDTARDVPLLDSALIVLREVQAMFPGQPDDTIFNCPNFKHLFIVCVKRIGIAHITAHDLRHTAITRYARLGFPPQFLMVISGHSDMSMLSRYTHLNTFDVHEKYRQLINSKVDTVSL